MVKDKTILQVTSSLKRDTNKTLEDDLNDFFRDLIFDFKRLDHQVVRKLSSSEQYIGDKLIPNTISNAQRYVVKFELILKEHALVLEELVKKYKVIKSMDTEKEWGLAITSFQQELNHHLELLSEKSKSLYDNLSFIENKYTLDESQTKNISKLKATLEGLDKISYDSFLDSLLSGESITL